MLAIGEEMRKNKKTLRAEANQERVQGACDAADDDGTRSNRNASLHFGVARSPTRMRKTFDPSKTGLGRVPRERRRGSHEAQSPKRPL